MKRSIQFYEITPTMFFVNDFPPKVNDLKELMGANLDKVIREVDDKSLRLRSIKTFDQKVFDNLKMIWNGQEGFDSALEQFQETDFEQWRPLINPTGSLTKEKISGFFKNIEPFKDTEYYNT